MTVVAVIDTSVWVSAFLNPDGYPARLTKAGRTGNFLIVSSLPLLDELHEVLLRPRVMNANPQKPTSMCSSQVLGQWCS